MWFKSVSREQLPDIFNPARQSHSDFAQETSGIPALLPTNQLGVIWRLNPMETSSLPSAILISKDEVQDFLAWAATYIPIVRPLTAYCRVLEQDTDVPLWQRIEPSLGRLEDACLGLILGEAATYLDGKLDVKQLSPIICARTYSYAMTRALALRILTPDKDPISPAWFDLRTLTKQPQLSLDGLELLEPWTVLLSLSLGGFSSSHSLSKRIPAVIVDACVDLYSSGDIAQSTWIAVTKLFPEVREAKKQMLESREERVVTFERSVTHLRSFALRDKSIASFLCGYLASQVSPGTFDHAMLVAPQVRSLPASFLWFGLCAGLRNHASLQRHLPGLGRRILREILRSDSLLETPRCDIAIAELEVLSRIEDQIVSLRPAVQGHLEVEIAPCVTTNIRWPLRHGEGTDVDGVRTRQDISRLLSELDEALHHADSAYQRLLGVIGPVQRPIPKTRRKRR